jgi:hypothetical protein
MSAEHHAGGTTMSEPGPGDTAPPGWPPGWPDIVREQQETIDDLTAALRAQQDTIDELTRRVALLTPPVPGGTGAAG